jgi:hypothetical protein
MPSAQLQPTAMSYGFGGVEVMCGVALGAAVKVSRPAISINRYLLLVQVGDSRRGQEDGHLVGSKSAISRRVVRPSCRDDVGGAA